MDIPTRYIPKNVEEKTLKKWLKGGYFGASENSSHKPFSIVIPPPNITGILHMGHALNSTIQDVLIRFRRMQGYESLWMPGTDHAGIATQNVVERQLAKEGRKKEDLGREKFLKRLWSWQKEYGSTILQQLKQLGASCDWQRTRFTMDEEYSDAVKEVFIHLYNKGLVYRGNYIINWCPRCKTALSDEEAEHREIDGWLYYLKYPVATKENASNKYIVVATTRPETMLGDTAVAINPKDKRFSWLKGAKIILPLVKRELKVIEDEAIDPEFGTGIVKVTPAHDPVDFTLGKKHNLEFVNIMNDDATLNQDVPDDFAGMDRFKARQAILDVLGKKKLIEKKEPYKISAGHCYRCHTVIEPRISLQWFVKMKPLAEPAIKVVEDDKVKFYPIRWKKDYLNWMYNIQDWCISRQIWWGHRLPVYYCKDCDEVIVSKTDPKECSKCSSANLEQDKDVLDTWFSSWLWPFATFYWPNKNKSKDLQYFYPTDCMITASEILFFWVARMIMAGLEFINEIPFKDVLIHGTVRDEQGMKMSKSLGNVIDPLAVIDKFGADSLRFSLMMLAASGSDVYLSDEKFLVGRNFSNKIWNATRFILLKVEENSFKISNFDFKQLDLIDDWVLDELDKTILAITSDLDSYSFNEAAKKLYEFFWHIFCDWYIEIVKDNFTSQRAQVLVYILLNSIKMLHPFMPFVTEEIFSLIKANSKLDLEQMLVVSSWPSPAKNNRDIKRIKGIKALLETIRQLRNIKIDLGLVQKKIKLQIKIKDKSYQDIWQFNKDWIKRLGMIDDIIFINEIGQALFDNDLWAFNFDIESAELTAFVASLDKKIKNLGIVLDKASIRLKNENFIKKASKEVVENEKNKFNDFNQQLDRLKNLKNAFT